MSSDPIVDALRELSCTVLTPQDLGFDAFTMNFGRNRRTVPRAVVLAERGAEIAHSLRVARSFALPVSVRGAGHSAAAHGLAEAGIVIANRTDRPEVRQQTDGTVEVSARTQWLDVQSHLNGTGASVLVRTNEPRTTVGGTISVGGFGPCSVQFGAQADQVESLELILPDGSAVSCSPRENSAYFRAALSGLGQVGVIEKLVLKTIRFRQWRKMAFVRHGSFSDAIAALRRFCEDSVDLPDEVQMQRREDGRWSTVTASLHRERSEAEEAVVPTPRASAAATSVVELDVPDNTRREIRGGSELRHLWCDYVLRSEAIEEFASGAERKLSAGLDGLIHALPIRGADGDRRGLLDVRSWPQDQLGFGVGFYFDLHRDDESGISRVLELHAHCLELCSTLGGRPYLSGSHRLGDADLEHFFGADYRRLATLRDSLDPRGLFNRSLF